MFAYILLIMLSWCIQMPLWASIVTTIVSGIAIAIKSMLYILESTYK